MSRKKKYGADNKPNAKKYAVRLENLNSSTTFEELQALVRPFGQTKKVYLAKDNVTNECKGFAYVHYKSENDALKAISTLNGQEYNYLILNVNWSHLYKQEIKEQENFSKYDEYMSIEDDFVK